MMNNNMRSFFITIRIILGCIQCWPHMVIYKSHSNRLVIEADIRRWLMILKKNFKINIGIIYLLSFHKEFRNLFYYRIGYWGRVLSIFCPGRSSLIIHTESIGEGLFIQHGFATAIGAKSIGKNCFINQQVTIGYSNEVDCPVILDNVRINAGAIIIGKVTIGNNAVIGANCTVFSDVPDNCTIIPPTPKKMQWHIKD